MDAKLRPNLIAAGDRAQDVEPEVRDILEHQGPVLAHLLTAAEPDIRMERLFAPIVLMKALHHGLHVVVVRGLDEPIDHWRTCSDHCRLLLA
jgi:hypothetical protein